MSGATSYHAGLSAEHQVAAEYARLGYPQRDHRWRGRSGEIDLITQNGDGLIFVEVKKSRDFARAAQRVTRRQMHRIYASASEYLGQMPNGQDTCSRFDVALVNQSGEIQIVENAFGM